MAGILQKMSRGLMKTDEGKDEVHTHTNQGGLVNPDDTNVQYTTSKNDHPGIGYTNNGAMKQSCFKPPQHITTSNADSITHTHDNKWTSDTRGTYEFGTNLDTHPHEDYAGPNLTATVTSPGDDEDLAVVQQKQGQEGRYDLLHGGFPTGAPSPGRGKGAEVVDKFDK